MNDENSILEKIIQSEQNKDVKNLNSLDIISFIYNNLSHKEKEVIKRRFSLDGQKKQTLEDIGKLHNITRERIRQIQTSAIKKIKNLKELQEKIGVFSRTVKRVLGEYGGIMEESHLLDELLSLSQNNVEHRNATAFIISELLDDEIDRIKKSDIYLEGWKLKLFPLNTHQEILGILHQIIELQNKLLTITEVVASFKQHDYYQQNKNQLFSTLKMSTIGGEEDDMVHKLVYSHMKIGRRIGDNILNQWGLKDWSSITPKRMGDKIYLILKREKRPMHFTDITKTINHTQFDKKIAYPATIHNELILDDRFILVGRGIYALQEWGYKSGTVTDVIFELLTEAKKPMAKDEIVENVLKKRMVKKSTIYLALTNKNKFKKSGDSYVAATSS